jgi:hypothetical protein
MINSLELMTFQSWSGCWYPVLDIIEHTGKPGLLTPIQMQYQETFNTNVIDNFLIFPTVTHMPQSD